MNNHLDPLSALRMSSAIFKAIHEQQLLDVKTYPSIFCNINRLAEAGEFIADTAFKINQPED